MESCLLLVCDDGSQFAVRARAAAVGPLLDAIGGAASGKVPAIETASSARTTRHLADWLATGELPMTDESALQGLYLLSARFRLISLRDDIERCIAGAVPVDEILPHSAVPPGVDAFADMSITARPALAMSSLMATTASAPLPAAGAAAGLTTPEYVSGRWRDMYAPAPGVALAASQMLAPSEDGIVDLRASYERRQRAAVLTALPDPFGLARR